MAVRKTKSKKQPNAARQAEVARLARREKVWAMYVQGRFQSEIAALIGVDQKTISNDLKALEEDWVDRVVLGAVDRHKAEQLAKLDAIERACWEAWARSCGTKNKTSAKSIDTGKKDAAGKSIADRVESAGTEENQYGDPRFLAEIRHCVRERCEILGLHSPKSVKVGGDVMNPIKVNVEGLDKARQEVEAWRRERFGAIRPGSNPARN